MTVAVNLMSAAAVKLGLTEEGDKYKDLDEARKLVTALVGLLDASATEISSFHAAPLRDGLKSLQLAFREASLVRDEPGQGPARSTRARSTASSSPHTYEQGLARRRRPGRSRTARSRPRTRRALSVSSAARRRATAWMPAVVRYGGLEDQREGAVGPAGAEVGTQHRAHVGDHGTHRRHDHRVGERVHAGAPLGEGQQHGPRQFEGHRPRHVQHHRVRLLVRGGLECLVQRYGHGPGRRVPAGQRVGGREGGQRGAAMRPSAWARPCRWSSRGAARSRPPRPHRARPPRARAAGRP